MMKQATRALWLCLLALSCSAPLAAAPSVNAVQLQALLHKQVNIGGAYAVFPIDASKSADQLAHAILDRMWESQAYRDNMQEWLKANQADIAEDLLARWNAHYSQSLVASMEFLDPPVVALLWRLSRFNAIYALDRSSCQTKSPQEMEKLVVAARQALFADNAALLEARLPQALEREFARQNAPKPGDRPLPEIISNIAITTLKALAATLPPDDAKRLTRNFSYQTGPSNQSVQEICEQYWVVSHAVNDTQLSAPEVSATLLRRSVTSAAYGAALSRFASPIEMTPVNPDGFTAGKSRLFYPRLFITNRAAGVTNVRISVNAEGKVSGVALLSSTVKPEELTSIDGSTWSASRLLQLAAEKYYRSGSFKLRTVDGQNQPYAVDAVLTWQHD